MIENRYIWFEYGEKTINIEVRGTYEIEKSHNKTDRKITIMKNLDINKFDANIYYNRIL